MSKEIFVTFGLEKQHTVTHLEIISEVGIRGMLTHHVNVQLTLCTVLKTQHFS